jgi:hypothetical protein
MTGWWTRWVGRVLALSFVLWAAAAPPAAAPQSAAESPWAAWVEPDFPFFSSVLDVREAGAGLPTRNLTPRALVLNLGGGHWAAFDTDLLRVAAIWHGDGVTPKALAPGSYHHPDRKTPIGQVDLPRPAGHVWAATGIYPGWQIGEELSFDDPREPAPSVEEVGRGPLPDAMGRFQAVRLVDQGVVLEYLVGGVPVKDWMTSPGHWVERHLEVGAATEPIALVVGAKSDTASILPCRGSPGVVPELLPGDGQVTRDADLHVIRIAPRAESARLCVAFVPRGYPRDPIPARATGGSHRAAPRPLAAGGHDEAGDDRHRRRVRGRRHRAAAGQPLAA